MNAKEIRSKRMDLGGPFVDPIEAAKVELLQEIAAQLAELNEPPAAITAEAKPEWVTLMVFDQKWTIDPSEIASVREGSNPSPVADFSKACTVTLRGGLTIPGVLGTHAEVCAKLGIPTEAS